MTGRIKKAAIFVPILLAILFVTLFLFRNNILHYIVDKKLDSLRKEYDMSVDYDKLEMEGLNAVQLQGFNVVPNGRDTLLTLNSLVIHLKPLSLMQGDIEVYKAYIDKLHLNFIKKDSISNYDFLFKKKDKEAKVENGKRNYSQSVRNLLNLLFGFLPENGEITDMYIKQRRDSSYTDFAIPSLLVKDSNFNGNIFIDDNGTKSEWGTKGYINSSDKEIEASILPVKPTKNIVLPYINRYYNAVISFDMISFSLKATKNSSVENLSGIAKIKGLHLFHKRLSPDTITVNNGSLSYNLNIGENYIEVDSATAVTINKLTFNPYLKAEKNEKWHIRTSINKPPFNAQDLFSSLPAALFQHLQGIETTGELKYNFLLDVDFANLDSLKFHSILRGQNFHITNYGNSELTKLNHEFLYTAYDHDRPVRTFSIGSSNPNFRTLDSISPLLRNAIIQSEDNGFMYHNGFLPGAIQEALVHDFKVKRFARGGSTISMQLVKNVFLTRHKNIARKLEEALMVWLIENQHITSKSRMFEVYLNIIEWGPMIYGAKEAAEYYFDKEPADLTLNESIFLASLIPRPKQFRSFFNSDGSLRGNAGYFQMIAHRLFRTGIITEEEAMTASPSAVLKGKAQFDIIRDTIPTDSVIIEPITNIEDIAQ